MLPFSKLSIGQYFSTFLLVIRFCFVKPIPIDNDLIGDPEIECGPNTVTVHFNTRNPFEGHVFVKNLFSDPACRKESQGGVVADITLPFDTCNVNRRRSIEPRGVFVETTVILQFHPLFITKVDRAYRISCFYMEADKTVSTDLEVSMLTTVAQTQLVPMPDCRYEILNGGPDGEPIDFALVGDPVYHKWICESEHVDTFCMVVHSCFVDDGQGDRVVLLDDDGCATDRFLLSNLEYPTDLMAGQEAHVFKYADRPQLQFQCEISITIKEPGTECPRPTCGDGPGIAPVIRPVEIETATVTSIRGRRGRRQRRRQRQNGAVSTTLTTHTSGTMDVVAGFNAIDLEDSHTIRPRSLSHSHHLSPIPRDQRYANTDDGHYKEEVCFTTTVLYICAIMIASLFFVVLVVLLTVIKRPQRSMLL